MENENIRICEIINETYFDESQCTGPTGPQGCCDTIGPTGPTGPSGYITALHNPLFVNAYSINEQKIETNQFIHFDTTNAIYGDCYHCPGMSEIFIWRPGCYSVYTSIFHMEACQFSLIKNSFYIAPVSTVGSLFGSSQNTNYFIIQISENDMTTICSYSTFGFACKLQLINNTKMSYMPYVTLIGSFSSGNLLPQITASITIQSIL